MTEIDPLLLGSVGFLLTALSFIIARVIKLYYDEARARQRTEAILAMAAKDQREQKRDKEPIVVGGRRIVGARRRRVQEQEDEDLGFVNSVMNDDYSNGSADEGDAMGGRIESDEHIGKKKLAKLQAKAERRAQREAEIADREEKKQRELEREKQREEEKQKKLAEEEAEKERKRIEREEKEKKEEEEYQKMKMEFEVDEEGFDQLEDEEARNLLSDLINYVKSVKVVNIDEMAAHFGLKPEEAVDRLKNIIDAGRLKGVMDDRGKFIFITDEEFQAVAKFINQRGRVTITELAEYSNRLINMKAV